MFGSRSTALRDPVVADGFGEAPGEIPRAGADVGYDVTGGETQGANHVVGLLLGVTRDVFELFDPPISVLE